MMVPNQFKINLDKFTEAVYDVFRANNQLCFSKDGCEQFDARKDHADFYNETGWMLDWDKLDDVPSLGKEMLDKYLTIYEVCENWGYLSKMSAKIQALVIQDFAHLLWEIGTGERVEGIAEFSGQWDVQILY
jgi:hypothetical protein